MSRKAHSLYKTLIMILAVVLTVVCLVPIAPVYAQGEEVDDTPRDFVLLLDCSGSMNENDRDHLTMQAAQKFIDLLPNGFPTRVSIVTFGPDYGKLSHDFRAKAGEKADPYSSRRVKIAYPESYEKTKKLKTLTDEEKEIAKKILDSEVKQNGEYSPIGYGLKTAAEILDKNSEKGSNHAAVILLTDGQVEGQADIYNGKEYDSINDALEIMKNKGWPVYCMELNYANENKEGDGLPGIAYYQMRQHIPAETGTEPIELKSADQASKAFLEIFQKMYPSSVINVEEREVKNGVVAKDVDVKDMTALQIVTISGEIENIEKITEVVIKNPGGDKEYSFKRGGDINAQGDKVTANFSNGGSYITMKMIVPEKGRWNVTAKLADKNASDGIKFTLESIALMDTLLLIDASKKGGEIAAGETISFTATYSYSGENIISETFCKEHPAKLYVNDQVVEMTSRDGRYEAEYTFEEKGSYSVYAEVESDYFKDGCKRSSKLEFTIDNIPPEPDEANPIGDITLKPGKKSDPVDLSQYFVNRDGDVLEFDAEYEKSVRETGVHHVIDGSSFVIYAGTKKGTFPIKVIAKDQSDQHAVQEFNLIVENDPVQLIGDSEVSCIVEYDDSQKATLEIQYDDYFADPDGITLKYPPLPEEVVGNECFEIHDNAPSGITITGKKPGTMDFSIIAVDASDVSQSQVLKVHVTSEGGAVKILHRFRIPLTVFAIIAIFGILILLAGFGGRRIYGIWDVTPDAGGGELDRELGTNGAGRKSRCSINQMLLAIGLEGDFGKASMSAGNNFNKIVYFENLQDMDVVELDGKARNPESLKKKIPVRAGQDIRLVYNGHAVTFSRLR